MNKMSHDMLLRNKAWRIIVNASKRSPTFFVAFTGAVAAGSYYVASLTQGGTNPSDKKALFISDEKLKRNAGLHAQVLAKANKELDEVKADRDAKAQRVSELEGLADERLKAAEELQQELAKHGGIKEKYDFSKLGSREVSNASAGGADKKEPPARSVPVTPAVDPLLAFVSKGGGGLRMQSSGTAHHLLGNAAGASGDAEIAAAIRAA